MSDREIEPFFFSGRSGRMFTILHLPKGTPRGTVLYIHPLAEELNKARRMGALQARELCDHGYIVAQPDLLGCGDSDGNLEQSSIEIWIKDLVSLCGWLTERYSAHLTLWGLRFGALLAAKLSYELSEPCRLIMWQPLTQGDMQIRALIRQRLAAEMSAGVPGSDDPRASLKAGQSVELSGYTITPEFNADCAKLKLSDLTLGAQSLLWVDVSPSPKPDASTPMDRLRERWQTEGIECEYRTLIGDSFWMAGEIVEVPALIEETSRWICGQR